MKPIIYLYFHSKIREWKGKEVNEKEFKSSLSQWRIPKNLRHQIMKEMEKIGLIERNKKIVFLKDFYIEVPPTTNHGEDVKYLPYEQLK